ncbi:MAG TPA: hypothetical protein VMC84_09120 [Methanocella sp.]|uniref:hypothetical protein n=1 Tax=Methanocella sp. TaxID=2052833 RepID=UPI002C3FB290|nr:hypothetical protein [Methanocella sp.]HTY91323.1 hypothetical protein [Methanocella sp.]
MSKILRNILLVMLALTLVVLPAYANLVPTTYGFPVIVQNGSTSAFNQDTACATDFENININFPAYFDGLHLGASTLGVDTPCGDADLTANVLPFGPVNLAFPDICQTVCQTQDVTHTDFAQTNEYAEFAYPFVGVGGVSLPGFGFGW